MKCLLLRLPVNMPNSNQKLPEPDFVDTEIPLESFTMDNSDEIVVVEEDSLKIN